MRNCSVGLHFPQSHVSGHLVDGTSILPKDSHSSRLSPKKGSSESSWSFSTLHPEPNLAATKKHFCGGMNTTPPLLQFSFWSVTTAEKNIWIIRCWTFHCAHQIVASCVCLLLQVVYSESLGFTAEKNTLRTVGLNHKRLQPVKKNTIIRTRPDKQI